MSGVTAAGKPLNWPKDSQKYDIYINEQGVYEVLLSSQQPKAKAFKKPYSNVLFPHIRQKAIEEKDVALTLLTDDLQERDNRIQNLQYENVALQAQRDVYQTKLQRCQDTITHLRTRYVPHARDLGKDNIIIIVRKHTTSDNDKFHDLPYYTARIQRRNRYVKLRWFDRYFPNHEVIVEIDNPNVIHAFNRFEEEGHEERKYNHFRLIDLTREELYDMGVSTIQE